MTGFVLTFDDVTELMQAQRKAAWADVARRIAHEIKNPDPNPTPAERLKRKYLKEIESDPDTFGRLTETIVRQVGDIGRMVDEFSAFARMPAPVMKPESLGALVTQQVDLQQAAHPGISIPVAPPERDVTLSCDSGQIRQALTNLLSNAVDSIEARLDTGEDKSPGAIRVSLTTDENRVILRVDDNGRGLPETDRDRLTEPYVTMREKGTGLGLAIVKKIMEDHGGVVELHDLAGAGASVRLIFEGATMDPNSSGATSSAA